MSNSLRKIEYYGICFWDCGVEYEDSGKLLELIESLNDSYIYDDEKSKKFWRLDSKSLKGNVFKLIFKSGKYNHSPNYISRLNGNERTSDKDLNEGECEKTHLVIDISSSSLIIESRKSGISAFNVIKYINSFCKTNSLDFPMIKAIKDLNNDFLENLDSLTRVQSVELFVEKSILGSEYMNLTEPTEESQEEVTITIKAQRKKTLSLTQIKEKFKKIGLQGEKTKRIRVRGRDEDNINVLLDSLNQYKVEWINVRLNGDGTVNSNSFFEKINELI